MKPMNTYHVVVTVSYEVILEATNIQLAETAALNLDIGKQTLFDVFVEAVEKTSGE